MYCFISLTSAGVMTDGGEKGGSKGKSVCNNDSRDNYTKGSRIPSLSLCKTFGVLVGVIKRVILD